MVVRLTPRDFGLVLLLLLSRKTPNLVVLFKEGADMAKMQEQMALWVAHLPEYKSGAENKKHELGEKRVFPFHVFPPGAAR